MYIRKCFILLLMLIMVSSCASIKEYHGFSEKISRGRTIGIMAYTWTAAGITDPGSPIGAVMNGEMIRAGYNIKAINIFSELAMAPIKNYKSEMIQNLNNVKLKGAIKDMTELLKEKKLSFFEKEEKAQQICGWFQKELGMQYLMLISRYVNLGGEEGVTYIIIAFSLSTYQLVFTQSITLSKVAENLENMRNIVRSIIIPSLQGGIAVDPDIKSCKFESLTPSD